MKRFLQVFFALFSSIITSLAIQNEFLPFGSPFLGLFALVPLYYAISKSSSFLESALLVGLQISITNLISSFWLGYFHGFAIFTLGGTTIAYFIFGFIFGHFFYLPFCKNPQKDFFRLCGIQGSNVTIRILFFSSLWVIFEWFKSNGFLAYPWGTLSMTAFKWQFITQIASITGTYGISFLFALFSSIIGEGLTLLPIQIHNQSRKVSSCYSKCAALCITLFLFTVCFGFYTIYIPKTPTKTLNAVIIQQNADPWLSSEEDCILKSQELTDKAIADYKELTGNKPDLIVWSEAVLSKKMPNFEFFYKTFPSQQPLLTYIKKTEVPFIIGGPVEVDFMGLSKSANSALYFSKKGKFYDSYSKRWLVPFAEIIPYQQYRWMQKLMQNLAGFSFGWVPGDQNKVFSLTSQISGDDIYFSTPICFEDAFPPICSQMFKDGAEIFVNITNDSWSKTKTSQYQHFVVASYRCIEFRTPMIRCANSGYSVVLDTTGKILSDLPQFTEAGSCLEVPIYQQKLTPYAILGNWLPIILLVLCSIYVILQGISYIPIPQVQLLPKETYIITNYVSLNSFVPKAFFTLLIFITTLIPIDSKVYQYSTKSIFIIMIIILIYTIKSALCHRITLTNFRVNLINGFLTTKTTDIYLHQIVSSTTSNKKIIIKTTDGKKYIFKSLEDFNNLRTLIAQQIFKAKNEK